MTRRHDPTTDSAEAGHVIVGMRYRARAELALIVERTHYSEEEALALVVRNGLRHWTQALGIPGETVNARDLALRATAEGGGQGAEMPR